MINLAPDQKQKIKTKFHSSAKIKIRKDHLWIISESRAEYEHRPGNPADRRGEEARNLIIRGKDDEVIIEDNIRTADRLIQEIEAIDTEGTKHLIQDLEEPCSKKSKITV